MSHADTMQQMMGDSTANLVAAAKRRLELWDIGEAQIEEIGRTGQTLKNLTLHSPISGFVMERSAFPKQHVTPETALYTIADLGTVWVIADVFEYEAANVRMDQPAILTLSYLPGRTLPGSRQLHPAAGGRQYPHAESPAAVRQSGLCPQTGHVRRSGISDGRRAASWWSRRPPCSIPATARWSSSIAATESSSRATSRSAPNRAGARRSCRAEGR